MSKKGFVKIDRSLLTSNIWIGTGERFTKGQAWVDLILLAEYEDNVYQGRERRRGEVHRSIRWLAKRWGWERRTVMNFLKELECATKCTTKCTKNDTTITLLKYGVYQNSRTTKCTTSDTTNDTQLRNIKNSNGKKEGRKDSLLLPEEVGGIIRYD